MLIKEIKPDAQSYNCSSDCFYGGSKNTINVLPKSREVLKLIVDEPCLKACEYLFECNIRTTDSSANQRNVSSEGRIVIDCSSLSEENKKVVEFLIDKGLIVQNPCENWVNIELPIDETTTVEEFSENMLKIASFFRPQEILYGFYTEKEMEEKAIEHADDYVDELAQKMDKGLIEEEPNGQLEIDSNGKRISLKTLIKMYVELCTEYYYDEKNNRYWICKELYDKAQSVLSKRKNGREIDGVTR